ncbi:MAG: AAA family ATPase [Methylovulum miyakonense]|uniref:AAA family ATPase n=1 Tax=Methylovulum miyakonense TaxID=645578 RepID=UPI003BB7B977
MLKRLYVHNYKCLVNFEINFDKDISLFLGANGSGKSTVFEVLRKVIGWVLDQKKISTVFKNSDKTRWLQREPENSRFEMDIQIKGGIYKYALTMNLGTYPSEETKLVEEILYYKNEELFDAKENLSFDNSRSCLFRAIFFGDVEISVMPFWECLQNIFVVRINPYNMGAMIENATPNIESDFSNFADWFTHLNEKYRKQVSILEKNLLDILPGFDYFRIDPVGRGKVLVVDFKNIPNGYDFNELSEGQKTLIALYALVYSAPENSIVCIDEPENFLALPEIQPWFDTLYDQCAERGLQALLISHHPRIINYLAGDSGYWFYRENNLTRVKGITTENEGGLSIAELVERGWIDDL